MEEGRCGGRGGNGGTYAPIKRLMALQTTLVLTAVRCSAVDDAWAPPGETAGGEGCAAFGAFVVPVLLYDHGHFGWWEGCGDAAVRIIVGGSGRWYGGEVWSRLRNVMWKIVGWRSRLDITDST